MAYPVDVFEAAVVVSLLADAQQPGVDRVLHEDAERAVHLFLVLRQAVDFDDRSHYAVLREVGLTQTSLRR